MTPQTPWLLSSYTNSTFTTLIPSVSAPTIIKTLLFAIGSLDANVKVQVTNSSSLTTLIIPASLLSANGGYSWDTNITLGTGDSLQVWADVAGVQFSAFGAK